MLLYIFNKFTSEQKLLIFVFALYRVHEVIILSLLFIFYFYVHRQSYDLLVYNCFKKYVKQCLLFG